MSGLTGRGDVPPPISIVRENSFGGDFSLPCLELKHLFTDNVGGGTPSLPAIVDDFSLCRGRDAPSPSYLYSWMGSSPRSAPSALNASDSISPSPGRTTTGARNATCFLISSTQYLL